MSATDELEHYMTACSRLKTENARLQAALDETHGRGFLERERDGYKALAERREKELEGIRLVAQQRVGGGDFDTNHQLLRQIQRRAFDARAAIDATPEEAREKGQ